jgi:NAD(P)-dependent dehydrogenase (short-subunit alcohol dehydrogenase family)
MPVNRATTPPPARGAALITGVSSGLGQALALRLLKDGYLVLGTVRKKRDGAYLEKAGGSVFLFDVTDQRALPGLVRQVKSRLGKTPLTLLVNNAGTSVCVAWEHMSLDEVKAQLDVNFFGAVGVTQAFLPLLRVGRGRIALVSSTAFRLPLAFMGAYCASKFALEAFALTLRQELYGDGIPVICLQPGPVQTRIFNGTRAHLKRLHPREVANGAYERFLQQSRLMERGGLQPEAAAAKIARILQKPRPPLRAVVSKAPWFDALMPLVPQRWVDYVIHRVLTPAPARNGKGGRA